MSLAAKAGQMQVFNNNGNQGSINPDLMLIYNYQNNNGETIGVPPLAKQPFQAPHIP
jgi:hypothetical protein